MGERETPTTEKCVCARVCGKGLLEGKGETLPRPASVLVFLTHADRDLPIL